MKKEIKSFEITLDPGVSQRRREEEKKVFARHGLDYDKLLSRFEGSVLKGPDEQEVRKLKETGVAPLIEGEIMLLENAVKRGITVNELLRNMIDSRIAFDAARAAREEKNLDDRLDY